MACCARANPSMQTIPSPKPLDKHNGVLSSVGRIPDTLCLRRRWRATKRTATVSGCRAVVVPSGGGHIRVWADRSRARPHKSALAVRWARAVGREEPVGRRYRRCPAAPDATSEGRQCAVSSCLIQVVASAVFAGATVSANSGTTKQLSRCCSAQFSTSPICSTRAPSWSASACASKVVVRNRTKRRLRPSRRNVSSARAQCVGRQGRKFSV